MVDLSLRQLGLKSNHRRVIAQAYILITALIMFGLLTNYLSLDKLIFGLKLRYILGTVGALIFVWYFSKIDI